MYIYIYNELMKKHKEFFPQILSSYSLHLPTRHMVLNSNLNINNTLNLPSSGCCDIVSTLSFGLSWGILRAWHGRFLGYYKKKKKKKKRKEKKVIVNSFSNGTDL